MHLFQRFANHAMESGALRVGRVFVKSLADQRMRESITPTRGCRYDADFSRLAHQLRQRSRALLVDAFDQREVEFLPNHGRDRQG